MSDLVALLKDYVEVAGGTLKTVEEGLLVFAPTSQDAHWFGRSYRVLALNPDSADLHPEAEMAVLGSRFAEDLLAAIRARGTRAHLGFLAPSVTQATTAITGGLKLRRGRIGTVEEDVRWLPLGRLHVAASVRTGHEVEDHLVHTAFFDLTSGQPIRDAALGGPRVEPVTGNAEAYPVAPARPMAEHLPRMLDDIEARLSERVDSARAEAGRTLQNELARLDGYYGRLIEEAAGDQDAVRAFTGEHARRRNEEIERNQASAELRPVQLEVVHVLAQQVEVTLEDEDLFSVLSGRRILVGEGAWDVTCPTCHDAEPALWAICSNGHVACSSCSEACTTCGSTSCSEHGGALCRVDGPEAEHALCADHALVCDSCDGSYCSEHSGRCGATGHRVCNQCLNVCEACGTEVCRGHTTFTTVSNYVPGESEYAEEPRALCPSCVRYCRRLKTEVRGRDEVASCQTCGTDVCGEHRDLCDVCGEIHCVSHLERTDRARRLVCPEHRAACSHDPGLLLASDEVTPCGTCNSLVCAQHHQRCYADGVVHCQDHVVELSGGEFACSEHHGNCVVDQRPARLELLRSCAVCGRPACPQHRNECSSCGAQVCRNDLDPKQTCRTCSQLRSTADPDEAVIAALPELIEESVGRPVAWEMARDATRRLARVKLSAWGRRVTFGVDHQSGEVSSAMLHGLIFTKRLRQPFLDDEIHSAGERDPDR